MYEIWVKNNSDIISGLFRCHPFATSFSIKKDNEMYMRNMLKIKRHVI